MVSWAIIVSGPVREGGNCRAGPETTQGKATTQKQVKKVFKCSFDDFINPKH
jgi:hypothetical protein